MLQTCPEPSMFAVGHNYLSNVQDASFDRKDSQCRHSDHAGWVHTDDLRLLLKAASMYAPAPNLE